MRDLPAAPLRICLVALALLAGASTVRAQEELPLVRLQLQWLHQAQFAGFYVADALGFYEREGLQVDFIPGGPPFPGAPSTDPLRMLALGGADVAVAWMSNALAARVGGSDVVNFAQILRRPATAMVCRRAAGIRRPADVVDKRIGVWNIGDQHAVADWLRRHRVPAGKVTLVGQAPDAEDFIAGRVDCATVMAYNEYRRLITGGISPADLYIVRFADEGLGFLEDGLYARAAVLADPAMRERLSRFVRASLAGWRYARQNIEEALALTLMRMGPSDALHQRHMLEVFLGLAEPDHRRFGMLDLAAFERGVAVLGAADSGATAAAASRGWTHGIWNAAHPQAGAGSYLTPSVRHYLVKAVSSPWFYTLTLVGTVAFAAAGFMRGVQQRYDLWGAFMLAMMPAVGGGTLRDLLIGGDRHPPFIFKDPVYVTLVIAVVAIGALAVRFLSENAVHSILFNATRSAVDIVGLATYAVIGAQVALLADLAWYWIPFCAAITCAGGGMLLDVVTGREPRTFQGEPYEEIAVGAGLLLFGLLLIANHYEHAGWLVPGALVAALAFALLVRLAVVRFGLRSPRIGGTGAAKA